MSAMSVRKGKVGERELCTYLRERGISAVRTAPLQSHRDPDHLAADVDGLPGCHLEVKRQERVQIDDWCGQAERDAGALIPTVVWRRSRQPWRVALPLDRFVELVRS